MAFNGTGGVQLWLNYNGSTNSILDDHNVSSVTDNGTGSYTVNITSGTFDNSNYAIVFGGIHTSGVIISRAVLRDPGQVTKNASSFRIEVYNTASASADTNTVSLICCGDAD